MGQRQWTTPGVEMANLTEFEHQSMPKHRLCHTAYRSLPTASHFLLFISHTSVLRFHLFLSYPSYFVVFSFQSPFLKVRYQASISLLYQVSVFFSSPSGQVFISSKFILDILLIVFNFFVLFFNSLSQPFPWAPPIPVPLSSFLYLIYFSPDVSFSYPVF